MNLSPNTRIGPYEIVGKLGEGGMGVVYRAHDTQLGRDVALKVLPEEVVADAERAARFEREAKVLASLNHANIAQIHGLETSGETRALVMELVEGPTLDERLADGPLPVDLALEIARQIAEGLEEAHGKGIVHRDLKPQNVKVSGGDLSDARVKVLDFGLAKAFDPGASTSSVVSRASAASRLAASPTLTLGAAALDGTMHGVILGSAPYMAPEQAKGMAVDKRADIWAFGVVLWEMLTGRRLFDGDSVPETLAGVLKSDIDLEALPENVPAAVRRLVRRCLERNPRNRLHDIADARIVLEEQLRGDAEAEGAAADPLLVASSGRRFGLAHLVVVGALAAIAAGAVGFLLARPEARSEQESLRLSLQLASSRELLVSSNAILAFTKDGDSLVFQARENGAGFLFRRRLGEQVATRIEGTEGAVGQFLSPDGKWVGFTSGGELQKVPIEGGRPFPLANARGAGGATWLPGDTLVFAPTYSDGLFRVSADGGESERLTTPDREDGVLGHWWPDPLPGAKRILFTAFRTPVDRSRIGVLDLETKKITWILENGFFARWSPSGHILFARNGRLLAVSFDPDRLEVRGAPAQIADDLRVAPTGGYAIFAISSRGTLSYVSESVGNPPRELVWVDRQGRREPATRERDRFIDVALSPDGRRAATTIQGDSMDLWILDLGTRALSRLTSSSGTEFSPVWSSDGREILYVHDLPPFEIQRITPGFPDSGEPLWDETSELDVTYPAAAPDGKTLAYVQSILETGYDLYRRPLDGGEPPTAMRQSRGEEVASTFSPDGAWIAYRSDETGRDEVYVEPFPGPGERIQVSADGGEAPVWARTGEIFYRHLDEFRVVQTRIDAGGFSAEPPETLFELSIAYGADEQSRTWDVTADGRRILAVYVPEDAKPRRIEIITGFFDQLEQLAPGR